MFFVAQTQGIIHFLLCWKDVFHPNELHIKFLLISINFTPRNWPYWPQNGESNFFQAVYHGMSLVDYGVMVPPFWYDWNPICLECIFETRKYLAKKQHPFHFEKKSSHTVIPVMFQKMSTKITQTSRTFSDRPKTDLCKKVGMLSCCCWKTRWWIPICFMFTPNPWGNDPIWRIFFKGVETTN